MPERNVRSPVPLNHNDWDDFVILSLPSCFLVKKDAPMMVAADIAKGHMVKSSV
jgi:hypothetical protein